MIINFMSSFLLTSVAVMGLFMVMGTILRLFYTNSVTFLIYRGSLLRVNALDVVLYLFVVLKKSNGRIGG